MLRQPVSSLPVILLFALSLFPFAHCHSPLSPSLIVIRASLPLPLSGSPLSTQGAPLLHSSVLEKHDPWCESLPSSVFRQDGILHVSPLR